MGGGDSRADIFIKWGSKLITYMHRHNCVSEGMLNLWINRHIVCVCVILTHKNDKNHYFTCVTSVTQKSLYCTKKKTFHFVNQDMSWHVHKSSFK